MRTPRQSLSTSINSIRNRIAMSDDNNNSNSKLYQHKDFTEMQGFLATIKAKAREKDDKNVIKVFQLAARGV